MKSLFRPLVRIAPLLVAMSASPGFGQDAVSELPWPLRLGARVHLCERNFPVVSQVVLVPDGAAFLAEIARWSPRGQWPVLFEDDPHAPGFIRRFAPDRILRAAPGGAVDASTLESRISETVASAWFDDASSGDSSLVERFAGLGWTPPGLVVADVEDPAWTAAVALAAGRGLPIVFDDADLGPVDGEMPADVLARFDQSLRDAAESTGLSWREMGDDIETIAVCKAMPISCRMDVPKPAQVWHAALDPGTGPYATTDALGRNARGDRWCFVSTIWGDEARAASMAMSSMFLPRTDLWLVSGYEKSGPWATYDMTEIAAKLPDRGYEVSVATDRAASGDNWLRSIMGGTSADVLFLNSHGFRNAFHLFRNTRLQPQDLPIIDHPMVVSMVHSFSLQRPTDPDSVGGRLLERGVYGYLGSVDEPFLMAFVPPKLQIERISVGVPFLVAGRYWPGEGMMSGVWKVAAIGDPLMLAPSDRIPSRRRVPATPRDASPGAIDLQESTRTMLESLRDNPEGARKAMKDLIMLGKDEVALGVWRFVRESGDPEASARAARASLGPLFRARAWPGFIDAYRRTAMEDRDLEARDMLWHLALPRLSGLNDPEVLMVLAGEARAPIDAVDLKRLAPHLDRVVGEGASRSSIERRLQTATGENRRKALQKLLED